MKGINGEKNSDAAPNRRSRLEIIADILDAAIDGAVKTRMMYNANINFIQINDYLEFLLRTRLIRIVRCKEKTTYKTTKKGRLLLHRFNETAEMLNDETNDKNSKPVIVQKTSMVYLLKR